MQPNIRTKNPAVSIRRRQIFCAGLLACSFSVGMFAQQAAPAPATSAARDAKDEETVELSPFVVDASQDQGYRATSTLAGSRINTDLKDLAAPITVVTKEFLTDIGAVDINDVVAYTANTEGSRDFTASTLSLGRPSDDVAASPNTATRLRGLERPEIFRDYFYTLGTGVGFDTYNLDQVTISRGPNSVLAGLGSPAGIINYSPQLAKLAENRTEVSYRFGSFEDHRATLNTNLVAKKDVLAFRLAGVWADRGFKQQPAWNEDQRFYIAATYKPWRKTTLRASYEKAKIDSSNPNTITPEDGVTQWIALGRPTYDRTSTAPVSPLLSRTGNGPTIVFNAQGQIERSIMTDTPNAGYDFFQRNVANLGIFVPQRMHDNRFFQLDEVNLSPSLQNMQLVSRNISIDQEILPGLNANIGYLSETRDNEFINLFRSEYSTYSIDVNRFLPNGAANPHFLETYMQYRGLDNLQTDHDTNEVFRGTLTYELDLRKHNKWFGRYRLTGFGEKRETEMNHWQYNTKTSNDPNLESVAYRFYLGGSDTRPASALPITPFLVAGVQEMLVTGTPSTTSTRNLASFFGLKSNSRQLEKLDARALMLQGYLWDDRIIGTYGFRRDQNERGFRSVASNGAPTAPAPAGYPAFDAFEQDTTTYGVVVRPLKWLSFHYNEAENFRPNAGSVDLLGNPTPPPTGSGKDYGFSVSLFDDKLNAKVNWFELTSANGSAGNANFPIAQWTMPYMELTFMPELASQAGITYQKKMAAGLITGDPRLANAYTSDNVSEGLELELTYNITRNWRLMATVGEQEAKQTNIASSLTDFIEDRLAYWKSIPALWTGFRAQNVGWGVGRTGEEQWNGDNHPFYIGYKSADGKPSTQLSKWHGSVVTNYTFEEGPLKGVNTGFGARYIEKPIIGHPAIRDAAGTVIALDIANPYYGHTRISLDAWVGYRRKIFSDRYDLSIQLNARDLEEKGALRPITANSDGGHPVYRIAQPRTFYLTTTVGF